MNIVPFLSVHLDGLVVQKDMQFVQDLLTREYGEALEQTGQGWTGFTDGKCIGCAGFAFSEPHKAVVWSLLGEGITSRNMITLHRAIKDKFDKIPAKRIELYTRDVKSHKRWAVMLGMTLETPEGMPGYWFDGGKGFLFAKVNNEI